MLHVSVTTYLIFFIICKTKTENRYQDETKMLSIAIRYKNKCMISTVGVYLHRFDNSHKTTRHDAKR